MSAQRFTAEFKEEAVKQVRDRGYGVPEIAARLGNLLNGFDERGLPGPPRTVVICRPLDGKACRGLRLLTCQAFRTV